MRGAEVVCWSTLALSLRPYLAVQFATYRGISTMQRGCGATGTNPPMTVRRLLRCAARARQGKESTRKSFMSDLLLPSEC